MPTAKPAPRVAAVVASMAGSVTGEDSQNAMTGANGTPEASRPAIRGRTVTPQTGVTAPTAEATTTVRTTLPSNASAIRPPAPLAMTQADRIMPGMTRGATSISPQTTNSIVDRRPSGNQTAPAAITATVATITPLHMTVARSHRSKARISGLLAVSRQCGI